MAAATGRPAPAHRAAGPACRPTNGWRQDAARGRGGPAAPLCRACGGCGTCRPRGAPTAARPTRSRRMAGAPGASARCGRTDRTGTRCAGPRKAAALRRRTSSRQGRAASAGTRPPLWSCRIGTLQWPAAARTLPTAGRRTRGRHLEAIGAWRDRPKCERTGAAASRDRAARAAGGAVADRHGRAPRRRAPCRRRSEQGDHPWRIGRAQGRSAARPGGARGTAGRSAGPAADRVGRRIGR
mmetsp:Transcript_39075/g.91496  ORF Transcript_39075/g.91496 Transcript_39075/m.91496 type:complete len:240 (+) Transcript_39075:1127-1846(+)